MSLLHGALIFGGTFGVSMGAMLFVDGIKNQAITKDLIKSNVPKALIISSALLPFLSHRGHFAKQVVWSGGVTISIFAAKQLYEKRQIHLPLLINDSAFHVGICAFVSALHYIKK
ncbi:MAG: hypothetical protein ACYCQJ_14915 [Nitrososphaerales archaeon]